MSAMTHVAGPPLMVDDRFLRQRCAWCGATLLDYDLELTAAPSDQAGTPGTWPPGVFVSVDVGVSYVVEEAVAPADSCMRLPVDATK